MRVVAAPGALSHLFASEREGRARPEHTYGGKHILDRAAAGKKKKLLGDKDAMESCPHISLYGKTLRSLGDFLPRLACLWLSPNTSFILMAQHVRACVCVCVPPDMSYSAPACPECIVSFVYKVGLGPNTHLHGRNNNMANVERTRDSVY